MRRTLERLEIEIRKILGAALFFAVAACLVVSTDKLLVWGSNLRTVSFIAAIVAGLIIAKVMLVVDLLPFVDAYPHKPLVYTIAWKAPVYIAAVLVQPFAQPAFWANAIWLAVLFLVFLTARELSRALGKDKMRLLFLGR